MSNFTESSEATRAWPQVAFSCAICTMSLRMFSGIRGRPACDFHFQNNLKPLRCQPIKVSGLTMTKASFQSQRRPEDETDTGGVVQSSRLGLSLLIEGQLLSQEQDLRAQGCARAEQETEEKKSVRDQIGDQLSRESSEPFALGKNRDMGCQDGIRSARLRSVFCQAGLAS